MEKKIEKEEFLKMVNELADRRPMLRKLLDHAGSYDKLVPNIKNLIDKELGTSGNGYYNHLTT